jgi:hypothetical protein
VEVGPNQQVWILASDVSYGEVLRTLQRKLGWEIEIPPLADELKLAYVRIGTTHPQDALVKLLEGSRLGYAFLGGVNGPRSKVVVIPLPPRETKVTQDTASSSATPDTAAAGASLPAVTTIQPNATAGETMPQRPEVPSTIPLSEAINSMGVPPGVSLGDVGKAMTLSMSDATGIMGVPPGMTGDVGKALTLSMSDATRIMGVPPGMTGDVGKTTTMPLPTGPGKHP